MSAFTGRLGATAAIAVAGILVTAGSAQSLTYGFKDITSGSSNGVKTANGEIPVGVVPGGTDLYNNSSSGALPPFIGKVYLGDISRPVDADGNGNGNGAPANGGNGSDQANASANGEGSNASGGAAGSNAGSNGTSNGGNGGTGGQGVGLGGIPGLAFGSGGGGGGGNSLVPGLLGQPPVDLTDGSFADGVAAVSLPASLFFFLSGLGGIWFVGFRRRSYGTRH